jgi:FtsZ-interacting cell division protein ZipA
VYILAKELGVKSTAIVKKCQDEGLDVKNHMSTISAGLAATIKEWFSEGENITTVETSERVDLKKVRIKKKEKKKQPKKKIKKAVKKIKNTKPTAETAAVIEEEPKPAQEQIIEQPQEPEPILPAGPILEKPEPARLSGPHVIRVEEPEPIRRPHKPKSKARYDMPITEPLMYTEQEE